MLCIFQWVLCTVHETHKYFIQQKKNFKFGSYDTINIFKNYFVIVFSVFSNKRYSNRPLDIYRHAFFLSFWSNFMLINIFSCTKYRNMKKYFEETFYI